MKNSKKSIKAFAKNVKVLSTAKTKKVKGGIINTDMGEF